MVTLLDVDVEWVGRGCRVKYVGDEGRMKAACLEVPAPSASEQGIPSSQDQDPGPSFLLFLPFLPSLLLFLGRDKDGANVPVLFFVQLGIILDVHQSYY